jgi:hypothetical protein
VIRWCKTDPFLEWKGKEKPWQIIDKNTERNPVKAKKTYLGVLRDLKADQDASE